MYDKYIFLLFNLSINFYCIENNYLSIIISISMLYYKTKYMYFMQILEYGIARYID